MKTLLVGTLLLAAHCISFAGAVPAGVYEN
jgi:uncharacterized membrane protein